MWYCDIIDAEWVYLHCRALANFATVALWSIYPGQTVVTLRSVDKYTQNQYKKREHKPEIKRALCPQTLARLTPTFHLNLFPFLCLRS